MKELRHGGTWLAQAWPYDIVRMGCFGAVLTVLGTAVLPASAGEQLQLPPLAVLRGGQGQPDFVLDLKTDRTPSAADERMTLPTMRKEPLVPFVGLTLTRPLDSPK